MNEMQYKKLLDDADFVEKIPPEQWNFDYVWEQRSCGSTGCALGHLANAGRLGDQPSYADRETWADIFPLAKAIYGLTAIEISWMFNNDDDEWYDADEEDAEVTPLDVAERMRETARRNKS